MIKPHSTPYVLVVTLMLATLFSLPPHPARAGSAFIPLNHPAYDIIDSLGTQGVLPYTPSVRPISWQALKTLLEQANAHNRADRRQLKRLFREAGQHLGKPGDHQGTLTLTGSYAQGDPLTFPTVPATDGTPIPGYHQGRSYGNGFGYEAEWRLENRLKGGITTVIMPRWHGGQAGGGNGTLQQGYMAWDTGPLTWSAGRQPLMWGPARHGGFLLTDNAAPLPMVRTGLTAPLSLGFPWGNWGKLDGSFFIGRLEADRVVKNPLIGGLRLTWQPMAHITIGGSRTVMLGGSGQGGLSADDLLTIITGKNLVGSDDTSNSIAGIDLSVDLPIPGQGQRLRLYGEYAGEDEADAWPTKPAVRFGLLLPGLGEDGGTAIRTEFAATDVFYDHQRWGHNVWYRHGIYQSGYTYHGRIIGDAMGPDARDARIWLTHGTQKQQTELSLGWRANRFSDPDRETHWQASLIQRTHRGTHSTWTLGLRAARVIDTSPDTSGWQTMITTTVEMPLSEL